MRILSVIIIVISFIEPLKAQNSFSFNCTKDTTIECTNSCITLKTTLPDIYSSTNSYAVNQTSSLSCFRSYVNPAATGSSAQLLIDDRYSPILNIGFNFPFFGATYNQLIASTNGFISFDITKTGKFSHFGILKSGNSLSSTSGIAENLPSQLYDKALIMGPYHDLDPNNALSSQQIKYDVIGNAPYRKWILSYYNVPLYTTACTGVNKNTHQIVLYETLGLVEIFIYDKDICLNWNEGRSMIGMQDFTKKNAVMAPGRQASDLPWGGKNMNESWRFVPASGNSLFKRVELYTLSGNFVSNGKATVAANNLLNVSFTNVCPPSNGESYIVKSFYKNPGNLSEEIIGIDTINVSRGDPISVNLTSATCAQNYKGSVSIISPVGSNYEYSVDGIHWQTSTIFNLPSGKYILSSRMAGSNCISSKSIDIDVISFEANIKKVITPCPVPLSAYIEIFPVHGTAPYLYSLDGSALQVSNIFRGLKEGDYTLFVQDAVGCTFITKVFISSSNLAEATVDNTICGKAPSGIITVIPNFGVAPYNYSINNGSFQNSNIFTNLSEGKYNITIHDSSLCTYSLDVIVGSIVTLYANPKIISPLCFGDKNGSITINPLIGQAPYSYALDNTSWQSNNVFKGMGAGKYNLHIKDAMGCIKDTIVNVNQPNPVNGTPVVSPAASCLTYDGQITVKANGGTIPYSYSIDGAKTFQPSNMFNVAAGTFNIIIRDNNYCQTTISDTVFAVNSEVAIDAGPDKTICAGSTAKLSVRANQPLIAFNWMPASSLNNSTSATPDAIPNDTTTYIVTAKSVACHGTDTVKVFVLHKPIADAGPDTTVCNNTFAVLKGNAYSTSGKVKYLWTPSGDVSFPNSASSIVWPKHLRTNNYRLQVSDDYGCNFTSFDEVKIIMNAPVTAFAGNDTIASSGNPIQLTGSGGISYLWSPAKYLDNYTSQTPLAVLQNDTRFNLLVKDTLGCIGTSSVMVKIFKDAAYYIPNAFTPNGDGLNDVFKAIAPGIQKTFYFKIFNRWGQLVFESIHLNQGWDGKYLNVTQPQDVYVWVIKGIDVKGKTIELKGTVTLLR